jgi:hypothetical protein
MSIYSFIILLHIIGTILGTGGATIAEANINIALKDKKVSLDERALMHATYKLIRVGMAFILVSIIGMVIYHTINGTISMLLSPKVLFKELVFLIIFANAIAITLRWIPLWLGAAVSFTSWWTATILGTLGFLPFNFSTYIVGYILAIGIVSIVLHFIKAKIMTTQSDNQTSNPK